MKRLFLSAQRVRALLSSNKLISALYLIGGVLAVFSMFFMYMTVISQDKYEDKEGYYTYTLLSGSEDGEFFPFDRGREAAAGLAGCLEDAANIRWSGFYADRRLEEIFASVPEGYADMLVRPVVLTDGRYSDVITGDIDLFALRQDETVYPVVLSPEVLRALMPEIAGDPTGTRLEVFQEEHTITDMHGSSDYYIMFLPDDPCVSELPFSELTLTTRYPLSGAELDRLEELAESLFETPVLKEPYTPYKAYLETLLSNLLMIAAFTAVAMLAFAFLFMFLLESRANEMRVMILCGASRLRVCLAVLSDAFVVNLLTGGVAVLAFVLMKDEIFSTVVNTTLHASDYLTVLLCFLGVSLLVCCPMLFNHATNTIAEMRRKYIK